MITQTLHVYLQPCTGAMVAVATVRMVWFGCTGLCTGEGWSGAWDPSGVTRAKQLLARVCYEGCPRVLQHRCTGSPVETLTFDNGLSLRWHSRGTSATVHHTGSVTAASHGADGADSALHGLLAAVLVATKRCTSQLLGRLGSSGAIPVVPPAALDQVAAGWLYRRCAAWRDSGGLF